MLIQTISPNKVDEKHLRLSDSNEVRNVLRMTAMERSASRQNRNGYSEDKEMRNTAMIPHTIYWDKRYNHIFHNPDQKEGRRLRQKFFRENWRLLTVDKL